MNDTIVTVRFTDLGAARRALRILKLLDSEGQLRVRAAALVERPAPGRVGSPSGAEDDAYVFLPGGGVVGTLVDALSGPVAACSPDRSRASARTARRGPGRASARSPSRRLAGISSPGSHS